MTEQRMTARQRRFAEAYLALGDARLAAEQAGYRAGSGERLLRVAAVQAYLAKRRDDDRQRAVASADEVLQYLTRVLRADAGQSSMKAAELLGKRLGLFAEQGESLPPPVIVDDIRAAALPDGGEALSEAGGRRESAAAALPGAKGDAPGRSGEEAPLPRGGGAVE